LHRGADHVGLDPFVGFLHSERPNRPALALDLMEEFRAWLADRLAVTLVNRQQVGPEHFRVREGGAVEFTDAGRKTGHHGVSAAQAEKLTHPLLEQEFRIAQFPSCRRVSWPVICGGHPGLRSLCSKMSGRARLAERAGQAAC